MLDLTKLSIEELTLKIGLEIFRAVSKENTWLEFRHLISYIKDHKKLDIDMVYFSRFDQYDLLMFTDKYD